MRVKIIRIPSREIVNKPPKRSIKKKSSHLAQIVPGGIRKSCHPLRERLLIAKNTQTILQITRSIARVLVRAAIRDQVASMYMIRESKNSRS